MQSTPCAQAHPTLDLCTGRCLGSTCAHTETCVKPPPDHPSLAWNYQRRDSHPCDVLDSEETGHDVLIRCSGNVLHLHWAILLEPRLRPVLQTGLWREVVQLTVTGDMYWDTGKGHHASEATSSGMEQLALDTERGCWHRGWPQDGMRDPQCTAGWRIPQLAQGSKLKGQLHSLAST